VALLYQAALPPVIGGISKPMKPGGYSDSGADIAYTLKNKGGGILGQFELVTPVEEPSAARDLDWVFPDTREGILAAISKGANVLWLNTFLFSGHPLEAFALAPREEKTESLLDPEAVRVVGQAAALVHRFDDKWITNKLLREAQLSVVNSLLVNLEGGADKTALEGLSEVSLSDEHGIAFPAIVKPIRGRGSQGVVKVDDLSQLQRVSRELLRETEKNGQPKYGDTLMIEEYLDGTEYTVTVMPPGTYLMKKGDGQETEMVELDDYWCLPAVSRFNHHDGVAPYNGIVAVTQNSRLLSPEENGAPHIRRLFEECTKAASVVRALSPIRIDCRGFEKKEDVIKLFDLNMKPNMTGPGRPGRDDQDSLSGIAARGLGWSYSDLLANMLLQAYPLTKWREIRC